MRMWVFLYSPHSLAQLRASSLLGAELQLRKARGKVCYAVPETTWKIKAQGEKNLKFLSQQFWHLENCQTK